MDCTGMPLSFMKMFLHRSWIIAYNALRCLDLQAYDRRKKIKNFWFQTYKRRHVNANSLLCIIFAS